MAYTPPTGSAANFSLVVYAPPDGDAADFALYIGTTFIPGWGVSGKIGGGVHQTTDHLGTNGIWQMRMTKRGKVPVKMKFYVPTNPQTVPQEANRAKFADAMAAWGALTAGEKSAYAVRAKRRGMFPWGLFVREYYSSH